MTFGSQACGGSQLDAWATASIYCVAPESPRKLEGAADAAYCQLAGGVGRSKFARARPSLGRCRRTLARAHPKLVRVRPSFSRCRTHLNPFRPISGRIGPNMDQHRPNLGQQLRPIWVRFGSTSTNLDPVRPTLGDIDQTRAMLGQFRPIRCQCLHKLGRCPSVSTGSGRLRQHLGRAWPSSAKLGPNDV